MALCLRTSLVVSTWSSDKWDLQGCDAFSTRFPWSKWHVDGTYLPLYTVLKTRCTWLVILCQQTSPHSAWLLLNGHHLVMSKNAVTRCLAPSLASRQKLPCFFTSLSFSVTVSCTYYAGFVAIFYVRVLFCNTTWYLQIAISIWSRVKHINTPFEFNV